MGLLDSNYAPDPLAQGLLGLGASLMTPRQLGGGLMAGANAFNQGAMQAQMMRRQMAQDAMRAKLIDAQIAENQAQADQRRALIAERQSDRERDAARQQAQSDFWKMLEGGPAAVAAQTGNLSPTNANAALLGQPPQIGPGVVAAAARAGIPIDTLKAVSESRNWGRDKVARTARVAGPDGQPMLQQLDEFGNPVGAPIPEPVKRDMVNVGNAFVPVNAYTQQGPLSIGMSPGERDASARGWAGVRNAQARLAFDQRQAAAENSPEQAALVARFGKPPQNFRWAADGSGRAEPIPGGPADPTVKDPKQVQRAENSANTADIVIDKIDSALGKVGWGTTGAIGALGGKVPGTTAYDLRADIETIKANIGFERLQQMREASPTGGALGQVAVQELNSLQAVLGNLDANQSTAQIATNLRAVRRHLDGWRRTVKQAAGQSVGQSGGATGSWGDDPLNMRGGGADNDPLGIRRR